ncbi:MAG: efflux RND transporter periplasmic adaptor subunit [Xanthobacteraceae bacterium]
MKMPLAAADMKRLIADMTGLVRTARTKRLASISGLVALGLFIGIFALWRAGDDAQAVRAQDAARRAGRVISVETFTARLVSSTADIRAIGSLQSEESVKVAAEVAGRVAEILFKEGQPVKQGDVLVKLDDSLSLAEFSDAEARLTLAQNNLERANQLARTGSVTERARDEAVAGSEIARAAVELARVRLAKHTVRAPFSGVAGLRGISVGAFVSVGTEVVSLEKIDSLKVDFSVPEVFLSKVQPGQSIEVTVDAVGVGSFSGIIYAIDPMVDINGRALRVRARLPNLDGVLRPGLFARILVKGDEKRVVMIPESAVVPRGGELFVFRIEDGRAVEAKVELGLRKAGEVEIRGGIPVGAVVVTAGHHRLRNGSSVSVVASGRPAS